MKKSVERLLIASGLALALVLSGTPGLEAEHHETSASAAPEVEFFAPAGRSGPPFSESVRVGNLLFLAGQIGATLTEGGRGLPPGGIGPETRQTMENIKAALERRGATMDDVVKCTVMLADIAEWAAMNEVYKTFFTDNYPARSAFGSSGLALGARVEIECIAVLDES